MGTYHFWGLGENHPFVGGSGQEKQTHKVFIVPNRKKSGLVDQPTINQQNVPFFKRKSKLLNQSIPTLDQENVLNMYSNQNENLQ